MSHRTSICDGIRTISVTVLLAIALILIAGCKSKGDVVAPSPAPEYRTLASAHNDRVSQLQRVYADGVIEIQWHDRKGEHTEQGNMELWFQQPSQTALRVEKLGEVLLWVGSDDTRYWFFDMIGEETVLRTGTHDEPINAAASNAFSVRPLVLLDLMGFAVLPTAPTTEPAVAFNPQNRTWAVEFQGRASRLRMYFDPATLMPMRIESLTSSGEPALISTLSRYESVFQKGKSLAAFPKMPEVIKIVSQPTNEGQSQSGEVAFFVNEATTEIDHVELTRVFDLERLIRGMAPARIEKAEATGQAATGGMH
jgi:hypothetical protein